MSALATPVIRASNEANGEMLVEKADVGEWGVAVGEARGVRSSIESEETRENLLEFERRKGGGQSLGGSTGEETCTDGMLRITCRSWLVISTNVGLPEASKFKTLKSFTKE